MLNIDVSSQHHLTLDNVSGVYSAQLFLLVEVINKSSEKVILENVKVVSKRKSLFSAKIKNEFSESRNDILNPESSFQFKIGKIPFLEGATYTAIINEEFISNEF